MKRFHRLLQGMRSTYASAMPGQPISLDRGGRFCGFLSRRVDLVPLDLTPHDGGLEGIVGAGEGLQEGEDLVFVRDRIGAVGGVGREGDSPGLHGLPGLSPEGDELGALRGGVSGQPDPHGVLQCELEGDGGLLARLDPVELAEGPFRHLRTNVVSGSFDAEAVPDSIHPGLDLP